MEERPGYNFTLAAVSTASIPTTASTPTTPTTPSTTSTTSTPSTGSTVSTASTSAAVTRGEDAVRTVRAPGEDARNEDERSEVDVVGEVDPEPALDLSARHGEEEKRDEGEECVLIDEVSAPSTSRGVRSSGIHDHDYHKSEPNDDKNVSNDAIKDQPNFPIITSCSAMNLSHFLEIQNESKQLMGWEETLYQASPKTFENWARLNGALFTKLSREACSIVSKFSAPMDHGQYEYDNSLDSDEYIWNGRIATNGQQTFSSVAYLQLKYCIICRFQIYYVNQSTMKQHYFHTHFKEMLFGESFPEVGSRVSIRCPCKKCSRRIIPFGATRYILHFFKEHSAEFYFLLVALSKHLDNSGLPSTQRTYCQGCGRRGAHSVVCKIITVCFDCNKDLIRIFLRVQEGETLTPGNLELYTKLRKAGLNPRFFQPDAALLPKNSIPNYLESKSLEGQANCDQMTVILPDVTKSEWDSAWYLKFKKKITKRCWRIIKMESKIVYDPKLKIKKCEKIKGYWCPFCLVIKTGDNGEQCFEGAPDPQTVHHDKDYSYTIWTSQEPFFQLNSLKMHVHSRHINSQYCMTHESYILKNVPQSIEDWELAEEKTQKAKAAAAIKLECISY